MSITHFAILVLLHCVGAEFVGALFCVDPLQCRNIDLCQSTDFSIQGIRHGDLNAGNTTGKETRIKWGEKACVFYKEKRFDC